MKQYGVYGTGTVRVRIRGCTGVRYGTGFFRTRTLPHTRTLGRLIYLL